MIGDQLRALRLKRGLSLRELGAQAGLSPTLLSQVERGVTEPSLSTLRRVASVFGESVAGLFAESDEQPVVISRPGERTVLRGPRGSAGYERITHGNGVLEVLRGVLEPGETSSDEPWGHASTECVIVVDGRLGVEIGGSTYDLVGGEAVTFDSRTPHRYLNRSDGPVEYLVAVTPPTP